VNGSYVYNHQRNFTPTPSLDYLDPTNHLPTETISGYEDGTRNGPHIFKVSGMYQLPWDMTASASYLAHSNFPYNPTIVTGTRANGLGTATINLTPQNTLHYPAVKTLDLNFDKTIRLGGPRRVVLNAAIFNISNTNTTLAQTVRQNTSTANNLTTIVGPRVARFGVRFNF
jgi:hypothetical protein